MPLDIFIPYWGDPGYLVETVESVLRQTSGDWLLTIVDDAYPDHTAGLYVNALEDERITYIRKDENQGITANYRTCVSLATQPMMMILGCDDVLLPNYVRTIVEAHEAFPEAAIIQPGVEIIDEDGQKVTTLADSVKQTIVRPRGGGRQLLSGENITANLMHGDWLYWPSLAFRTAKLREVDFREGFPIIQDLALVMDMLFRGDQLLIEPTVCFRYRRHMASASSSKLVDGSRFNGEREYFELAAEQAGALGWTRTARAAKLRLTSRAHAATLLPGAVRRRDRQAATVLGRHIFGS
jgi:glycosyltransferase involved in cell wall biosynthesis